MRRPHRSFWLLLFGCISIFLISSCDPAQEEIITTHPDGSPKLIYGIRNQDGKKVRVYEKVFYENGQLRHQGHFNEAGQRVKVWKFWFSDGKLFAKGNFSNNIRGDHWTIYRHKPYEEIGKKETLLTLEITPEGYPVFCEYGTGTHSVQYVFHPTFQLMLQRPFLRGKPHGEAFGYDEKGKLVSHHFYANGKEDGKFELFHGNGKPRIEGQYDKGEKTGVWNYYDTTGHLLHSENHDTNAHSGVSSPLQPIYLDKNGNPIQ